MCYLLIVYALCHHFPFLSFLYLVVLKMKKQIGEKLSYWIEGQPPK